MGGEVTYFTKATSTAKLISAKLPIITQKIIQNKRKRNLIRQRKARSKERKTTIMKQPSVEANETNHDAGDSRLVVII